MAVVMTPALMDPLARTAPARPAAPRELLAVPGQPRALEHHPEQAPGRIPVPASAADGADAVQALEDIEAQKEASVDYQILKGFVAARGKSAEDTPRRDDPEAAAPSADPDGAGTTTTPAPAAATDSGTGSTLEVTRVETRRREVTVAGDRIEIDVETLTYERVTLKQSPPPVQKSDPLALDLDGDGLKTTGIERGMAFDIDGDGATDRTSFVTGGDAFVALDRNDNGMIDSGRELFGDQNGDANGFLALAAYDGNGDRRIDAQDAVYSDLRLLRIGADSRQQLSTLAEAGVRAIDLDYSNTRQALNTYDSITQLAGFEREDGSRGIAGDVVLGYRTLT